MAPYTSIPSDAEETPTRPPNLRRIVVIGLALLAVSAVTFRVQSNYDRDMQELIGTSGQDPSTEKVIYGTKSRKKIQKLWKEFTLRYSKKYRSKKEEQDRFQIFKKNLQFIDNLNFANPNAVFTITDRTDWTDSEMARMRGLRSGYLAADSNKTSLEIMKDDFASISDSHKNSVQLAEMGLAEVLKSSEEKDKFDGSKFSSDEVGWVSVQDCAACALYPHFSNYTMGNLPDSFDWRAIGDVVTDVKNQKYCGSCWSFSTAQDIEGKHYFATGERVRLSEQQLVACDTKDWGCDGGYPYRAMQYISQVGGMLHEASYPYKGICAWGACGNEEAGTPTCDSDTLNTNIKSGNVSAIGGWQMVAMGEDYEDLMRVALVKNGPISISLNANGMDYYVHGVVGCSNDDCNAGAIDMHTPCEPTALDHAVLLVGYGTEDDIPYWLIKNSWGDLWGEDGYYRLVRGSNHCGVANFAITSVIKAP